VPETGANVGDAVASADGKVKTAMSNLLTVWRTLYIELDSMAVNNLGRPQPLLPSRQLSRDLNDIYSKAYVNVDTKLLGHSSINTAHQTKHQVSIEKFTKEDAGVVIPGRNESDGAGLNTWVGKGERSTQSSEELWVVWVIGASHAGIAETGLLGVSTWTLATQNQATQNQRPIYIFTGVHRQIYDDLTLSPQTIDTWDKVDLDVYITRTVAHEILHRFGGEHGTMGIMGDDADGTYVNKRDRYNSARQSMFRMNLPELKLVRESAKGVS
jgi:hypothetical protein